MHKKNIVDLTRITRDDYRRLEKLPLLLLADNVRSGQNIGSMLRTSDAFMVREVIMAGISPVPPSAEISKTALGAEESVGWRYVEDAVEEVKRLKENGVAIFVLEQIHESIPLQQLDRAIEEVRKDNPDREILIVVGNEVNGVDQRIVDLADFAIEIPMHGIKHSLNVAVSAGIALWEAYKCL
ncbi:MAG: TrmH family RNA methyltransferase [Muribaculaceae bacterium]|nr:TrmH family RNA methyltransferase [Muribaculaceae bacterium]